MKAASYFVTLAGLWSGLAAAFTNPIKTGSDPHIVYVDGMYYLTSTTWTDVQITAASTIEGLKTAEAKVIYSDRSDPSRACNFWAPEMHKIGDRWYVYLSMSICHPPDGDDWEAVLPTLRVYVLGGGTENPLSADYEFLGMIRPPNYDYGMLDASLFDIDGKSYFFYSSVDGPPSPDGASLWVAELLSPTESGNATLIAAPEYDWEHEDSAVLEGPYGIVSPCGTIYIVYSADSCNTPAYKLGAMKFTPGGDPLSPESWTKFPEPIFETGNGLYGPAHNAFFKSPDGKEDWQVFHANLKETDGCGRTRQTFVQPVHWKGNKLDLGEPMPVGTEIEPPSGE